MEHFQISSVGEKCFFPFRSCHDPHCCHGGIIYWPLLQSLNLHSTRKGECCEFNDAGYVELEVCSFLWYDSVWCDEAVRSVNWDITTITIVTIRVREGSEEQEQGEGGHHHLKSRIEIWNKELICSWQFCNFRQTQLALHIFVLSKYLTFNICRRYHFKVKIDKVKFWKKRNSRKEKRSECAHSRAPDSKS